MKQIRAAIYARVSTNEQTVDMQLRDLRAYAIARNLEVMGEFVDTGVSGSKTSRLQLNKLMDAARKHKVQAVLVWRFDRFGRSTKHLIDSLLEFKALNIQFISYQENLDTSTPMGQVIFVILAALAEFERNVIIERVNAGLATAKAKGTILGRPMTRDDAAIKALRAEGFSLRTIAKQLDCSLGSVQRGLRVK